MKIKQDRDRYNIGRNIRAFRLEHDMTQEQIVIKLLPRLRPFIRKPPAII